MKKAELKEQLQEDLMTFLEGMDDEILEGVCQIIIDNVNKLEE
jgi:hypothetical protein